MEAQTSGLEVGEWLWIPSRTEAWQAGVIIGVDQRDGVDYLVVEVQNTKGVPGGRVTISLGSQRNGSGPAFHRWNKDLASVGSLQVAQDLSKLALLHEPAVLQALQLRFEEGIVYTSSGPVLLAVNPYRQIPNLYDNSMLRSFMDLQLGQTAMPHIYGTANDAYNAVWHKTASQTVLVSGESGSGKTETTKFVMRFIAFASAGGQGDAMSAMESREKQVLQSIPLLEALGNAKTLRNDNSSRFGKYIEMQLRVGQGTCGPQLVGARTHTYLLEKVRVMGAREGERSFHIFYQVLAAASAASATSPATPIEDGFPAASQPLLVDGISIYGLTEDTKLGTEFRPSAFTYLNHSSCEVVANCDEVKEFDRTISAMRSFNMADSDIGQVLTSLVAVLHLGNLAFRTPAGNSEGSEIDVAVPGCPLHSVSTLLGVRATDLQDALCRRNVKVTTPRNVSDGVQQTLKMAPHRTCAQAAEGRNALARHLYGAIFSFVVEQINTVLSDNSSHVGKGRCSGAPLPFVGVLDIFGFEFFEVNSFEQLCVNFTNELLQQYFNEVIFKHEAALYIREQVPWNPQDFPDNSAIVELVAGVPDKPLAGVFPMLDEECNITGGTHMTWCSKLSSRYKHSELFKVVLIRRENFTIQHFAGPVEYTSDDFLEKNRDILSADVLDCMCGSQNSFIHARFVEHGRSFGAQRGGSTSGRVTRARAYSVSSDFRQQLKVLMQNIRATTPHFVRCIKPNPSSLPREFDRPSVVEQLRYQGVLEAIRVSRAGYPLRLRHREAVIRYRPLMPRAMCQRLDLDLASQNFQASARRLFEFLENTASGMTATSVQVGDTLVFFKSDAVTLLDGSLQQARSKAAIQIQANWRRVVARNHYRCTQRVVIYLQAVTRGILARRLAAQLRRTRAVIILQRVERGRRIRRICLEQLRAVVIIQRRVNAWQTRAFFCKAIKAIARLQRWHHSVVQRIRCQKRARAAMQMQRWWRGTHVRICVARLLRTRNRAASRIARHWRFWVLSRIRDRAASQNVMISGSPGSAQEKQCEHTNDESSATTPSLGSSGELLAAIGCLRSFSDATWYEISSLKRSCSALDRALQLLRSEEALRQRHQDRVLVSTAARAVAEVEAAQAAVQTYTAENAKEQQPEVQHNLVQSHILHKGQQVRPGPGGEAATAIDASLVDQLPSQIGGSTSCAEQASNGIIGVSEPREVQIMITTPKTLCESSVIAQATAILADADADAEYPIQQLEQNLQDSPWAERARSCSSNGVDFEGDASQVSHGERSKPKTQSCSSSLMTHSSLSSDATQFHACRGDVAMTIQNPSDIKQDRKDQSDHTNELLEPLGVPPCDASDANPDLLDTVGVDIAIQSPPGFNGACQEQSHHNNGMFEALQVPPSDVVIANFNLSDAAGVATIVQKPPELIGACQEQSHHNNGMLGSLQVPPSDAVVANIRISDAAGVATVVQQPIIFNGVRQDQSHSNNEMFESLGMLPSDTVVASHNLQDALGVATIAQKPPELNRACQGQPNHNSELSEPVALPPSDAVEVSPTAITFEEWLETRQSEQQTSKCWQDGQRLQGVCDIKEKGRLQDQWFVENAEDGDPSDEAWKFDETHNSSLSGCRSSSAASCESQGQGFGQRVEASQLTQRSGQFEKAPTSPGDRTTASPGGSDICTTATSSPEPIEAESLQGQLLGEPEEDDLLQVASASSMNSSLRSLPSFNPRPPAGLSARLFCESSSQRGFGKFWSCIGPKWQADDLPRPHRLAARLAARARRRAPRRFNYQGLLTQATAVAGQVVADHTAYISSQALDIVPRVPGSWSWIVVSSAEVQVQKLVHMILTYNSVASGARGTEALRGNFSVPMYTRTELRVMHPIRLHEHAVMLLQSVQRARALSEAPAADDTELIPWILRAQQLYTDEQQSARGLCNQESLSRLAAMCLGFLSGHEEEGFWLLHYLAEEVLEFRSIKAEADAALFVEMLAHEAPRVASAFSVEQLEEVAKSLVAQCWPCAFVGVLIDEPLIRLWEELLYCKSSAYPRFPLFKWLLGLVRSAEVVIMQMLPTCPAGEVVPQLCSHVRQNAQNLAADWQPRLSLSDRRLLKVMAAATRSRSPTHDSRNRGGSFFSIYAR